MPFLCCANSHSNGGGTSHGFHSMVHSLVGLNESGAQNLRYRKASAFHNLCGVYHFLNCQIKALWNFGVNEFESWQRPSQAEHAKIDCPFIIPPCVLMALSFKLNTGVRCRQEYGKFFISASSEGASGILPGEGLKGD